MKRMLPAMVLVLAACGGTAASAPTVGPPASVSAASVREEPLRILSLGDSYTIGQGVAKEDRWPVQLGRLLEEGGAPPVEVDIVARSGWTTADLLRGVGAADPQGPYDLVTLSIGVNNQYEGGSTFWYREDLASLIERAQGLSTGQVLVVSVPDWGATPVGARSDTASVAAEIDEFNAVAADLSAAQGVLFVDITPISRSGGTDLVGADGLHPSATQYAAWAEVILPVALALLDG